MIPSFTIYGSDILSLSKATLFTYFSSFGKLSDHIVRSKTSKHAPTQIEDFVGLNISFRGSLSREDELLSKAHNVEGVIVRVFKNIQPSNISDRKIFIKYLDKRATVGDIENALSPYGQIINTHLTMKKNRPLNLGLCNVTFESPEAVKKILQQPAIFIRGKKVKIDLYECHGAEDGQENGNRRVPQVKPIPQQASAYRQPIQGQKVRTAPLLPLPGTPETFSSKGPYNQTTFTTSQFSKVPKSVLNLCTLEGDNSKPAQPLNKGLKEIKLYSAFGSTKPADSLANSSHFYQEVPQSLDFSLVEEECEESPRKALNKQGWETKRGAPDGRRRSPLKRKGLPEKLPDILRNILSEDEDPITDKKEVTSRHSSPELCHKPTSKTYFVKTQRTFSELGSDQHQSSNIRINRPGLPTGPMTQQAHQPQYTERPDYALPPQSSKLFSMF